MEELKKSVENLTILYAEDEKTSREQLFGIFNLLFKSVDTAFDGEDAFEQYSQQKYDIVITDISMPRMNGIELIKKIKKQNPSQNIIIISAHNNAEYLLEAIEMGVDSFIIKPLQMEQLILVLSKVSHQIYAKKLSTRYHQQLEKAIEEKTQKLAKQYITDELTGFFNRNALINASRSSDQQHIILLLNVDNFDNITITYGYDNSDIIIQSLANVIKEYIPKDIMLYRINSNEFALVTATKELQEMQLLAQTLQKTILQHTITFDAFSIKTSVTIAIAEGKSDLVKNAYIALKEAQKIGKNRIQIYQKDSPIELLQSRIQEYMPKLRRIVAKRYVVPYFQPIINNKNNSIEKYECLARVIDDDGNIQSPLEFIDIAELTGMIPDITKIMIDKSFQTFTKNDYEFSINISEYDLNDGYLEEFLNQKIKHYNIEVSRVVLEVLEGISAIGAKKSLEQLMNLKRKGFSIAIDDFSVQNSNFERVHSMQVDYIKIDGSFIKDMSQDKKSYNVVKTISDFGKSIGAKVIAEYVHSKEVQDIVLELEIDYSQGYYFSEPLRELQ